MIDSDTMLKVSLKSNLTLHNQLIKWGLHLLIYHKLTLSLIDARLLTLF